MNECFEVNGCFDYLYKQYLSDSFCTFSYLDLSPANSPSYFIGFDMLNILGEINSTLSDLPSGSYGLAFFSGVIGALVAAFAAFLLNFLFWKKNKLHNRVSHFAALSIIHLEELEDSAVSYWIEDKTDVNTHCMQKHEIGIRTRFDMLKSSVGELFERIDTKYASDFNDVNLSLGIIYDAAMGDDFESADKKRNRKIALVTARECGVIRRVLHRYSQFIN